jgi:hypothetical protein
MQFIFPVSMMYTLAMKQACEILSPNTSRESGNIHANFFQATKHRFIKNVIYNITTNYSKSSLNA